MTDIRVRRHIFATRTSLHSMSPRSHNIVSAANSIQYSSRNAAGRRIKFGLRGIVFGLSMFLLAGGENLFASTISVSGTTVAPGGPAINLTTAGNVDWYDVFLGAHKKSVPRISFSLSGSGNTLADTTATWTDAAPLGTSGSDAHGVYANYDLTHHVSYSSTFSVTAPDTQTYILTAYLGGYAGAVGGSDTLTVTLPGAATYSEVWNDPATQAQTAVYDRNYTINFQANSAGDVLTVNWQADSAGKDLGVSRAAALSLVPEPATSVLLIFAIPAFLAASRWRSGTPDGKKARQNN